MIRLAKCWILMKIEKNPLYYFLHLLYPLSFFGSYYSLIRFEDCCKILNYSIVWDFLNVMSSFIDKSLLKPWLIIKK